MRILVISSFYPPYVVGGWEQLVQDVNERLRARGHEISVLTSNYGVKPDTPQQPGITRVLNLEGDLVSYKPMDFFLKRSRQLKQNLAATRKAIASFKPDVILIQVMWNLSKGVAWQAEQLCRERVVYYIANNWPYAPDTHQVYWRDPAQRGGRRLVKQLLAPLALRWIEREAGAFPLEFKHVLCVSQAVWEELRRNARIPQERLRVVYNGVETDRFTPAGRHFPANGHGLHSNGLSLLYAGSLVPHKGVHVAVEAMALIARQPHLDRVTLTIVGSGHPDYEAGLRKRVVDWGLEERVRFWPRVGREEMPTLLQKFDILVFPSIWQEPLARIVQEAMASGLVVIGTPTGGTPEALIDGQTGLTFQPEDAAGLATCVDVLARDSSLRTHLAENARELVVRQFDLRRMVVEIETYLEQVSRQTEVHPVNDWVI